MLVVGAIDLLRSAVPHRCAATTTSHGRGRASPLVRIHPTINQERLVGQPGRPMEVLDLVSSVQWTQTLRRIAAAPSPGEPADAHRPATGTRTDGGAWHLRGCPKGRIRVDGIGTTVRIDAFRFVWFCSCGCSFLALPTTFSPACDVHPMSLTISNAAWVIRPLVIGRLEACSSPVSRDRPCAGLGHRS